jgi:hypothetical protein
MEQEKPKTLKRRKRPTQKRRRTRPLGLGQMAQKQFPFVAVLNGETVVVDRIDSRITFTPWI